MNRKESRGLNQGVGDNPQLLKRSSTRSNTRFNDHQKPPNVGRASITDAFFGGEIPEPMDIPVRGASFFMGQNKGNGVNGLNQHSMTLQRNPSRVSKLEKNLSGIFMKNQQSNMHDDLGCCDAFGAPQLTHLQSIPQFNRAISDIPPLKRNSSKKSDNDTIGKMIGQNNQNQMQQPAMTRKNSKLANALNLAQSNNMMLNSAGFFGMNQQDPAPYGSFYDITNPTWDNQMQPNGAFTQFQPGNKNKFSGYFEKFERKNSMGGDSTKFAPASMQNMQEKAQAVTATGKSTLLGKRTRQQISTTSTAKVPAKPQQQNLLTVPAPIKTPGSKRAGKQKAGSSSNSDRASSMGGSVQAKQRGRKREKWEKYVQDAKSKIDEFKAKLSTAKKDKIDVKLRQKWRNIVSAQQSRLKKKFEVIYLHNLLRNKDDSLEQIMDIFVKNLKQNPDIMEKIRQEIAKIELPDPHPEEDCDGHDEDDLPTCLQKLPNGKFKNSNDKVSDFRQTFKYKFITPEEELNRYKHNDEKDEEDYDEEKKKKKSKTKKE